MNILDPQGPIGAADTAILIDSVAIMLAIVLPTIVAIFAFAYWFRASNTKARYLPNWEYSGRIELVVWSVPALTIILLGGVAWIGAHQLDPAKAVEGSAKPLTIQAVSLDCARHSADGDFVLCRRHQSRVGAEHSSGPRGSGDRADGRAPGVLPAHHNGTRQHQ